MRSHRLGLELYPLFYPECFASKAASTSTVAAEAAGSSAAAAAGPSSSAAATAEGELSEYERLRNDNILANQARRRRIEPAELPQRLMAYATHACLALVRGSIGAWPCASGSRLLRTSDTLTLVLRRSSRSWASPTSRAT